jgi:hypothetical protein
VRTSLGEVDASQLTRSHLCGMKMSALDRWLKAAVLSPGSSCAKPLGLTAQHMLSDGSVAKGNN